MSISQAIEKVETRYAHQPEFVQAVKEVALTIAPLYDAHPEYEKNMKILKFQKFILKHFYVKQN